MPTENSGLCVCRYRSPVLIDDSCAGIDEVEDYRISLERAANLTHMVEVNVMPDTRVGEPLQAENLNRLLMSLIRRSMINRSL